MRSLRDRAVDDHDPAVWPIADPTTDAAEVIGAFAAGAEHDGVGVEHHEPSQSLLTATVRR